METTSMYHHHDEKHESCGHRGPFGHGRGFRPPFGPMHGHGKFGGFGGPGGLRARRGDVRDGILRLLAEAPMHGYQIIQELGTRSGGAWRPSAGSVYPTLQLLEDEGLVASVESGGKRVYELTEAGNATVAEKAEERAPWEEAAESDAGAGGLRENVGRMMGAVWQIAQSGNQSQIDRAVEIVADARKKLYAILAED